MTKRNSLEVIIDWIAKITNWAIDLALVALVLLVFFGAISRYAFNMAWSWTEEVNRLLFLFISYMGILIAFKDGKHVCLTILTEGTTGVPNTIIKVLRDISITAILVFLMVGCYGNFSTSTRISAVFKLSWKWFCGPMLVSMAGMLALHFYQVFMRYVKNVEVNIHPTSEETYQADADNKVHGLEDKVEVNDK